MTTAAVILAAVSIALSLASAALSLAVMRQSGGTAALLQRHRLGHLKLDGVMDPAPHTDRRKVNVGPPCAVGERRVSPGHVLPPEDLPPEDLPTGVTPITGALPRPGQIGKR